MNGPSPHLSWQELACKDGTPYPESFRRDGRARVLAEDAFEPLRALVGAPLVILSAYRTPERNRAERGARNSQHMQGRALDLRPPTGWTVARLRAAAERIPGIRGIGVYPTFLHIDVRETSRRAVWHGSRVAADGDRT